MTDTAQTILALGGAFALVGLGSIFFAVARGMWLDKFGRLDR